MFLSISFSYAQTYDTTQYFGKMNYIFQNVNKSLVTSGFLKDYGIEFLNLDNYKGNGLHDSNFVSIDEWRVLYSSLYSSQVNGNANMLYLDTINRLIKKYNYTTMPITFAGLYYSYQRFRDDAVTANLMSITNGRLYDVAGRTQSPYQTEELFAVAPTRQALFTGNNNIIFRPELFKTNTGKTISSIAIDTATGSSYVIVPLNTPFNLTYNTKGFYNLNIKIVYTDGTTRYSHTKLVVYDSPLTLASRYGTAFTPATTESVTASKAYLSVLGQGDITIDFAKNNTTGQIRKPLIVVEGFDPDGGFTYSGRGGYLDYLNFDQNSRTTITLNNGLDDINEYDLIFLNFANGTDYIQRNAYLMETVIQIVNTRKQNYNGARQQNVIIGMSMGGLIARYALRDMELTSVAHEIRLFISHDSPHWGANIPVGAQAAVQHLGPFQILNVGGSFPYVRWVDLFPAIVDALQMFNSPAAKQMLIQRYDLGGADGQTLTANNIVHDNFLSEINGMGWPLNCKNLTLANGACNGVLNFPDNSRLLVMNGERSMTYFGNLWRSLIMTIGAPLTAAGLVNGWGSPQFNSWAMVWQFPLSLFSTKSSIGVDFFIDAVPKTGSKEIYRGDIYSKKKILFVINVSNYFVKCHAQSTTNMLPLDNAPGGVYDLENFGFDPAIIQNSLPSFFQGYVQTTVLQPRFCFVPTVSSLAINNPSANIFSNICSTVACNNPASVEDYFVPTQNQIHISYTQPSSDWILQKQNPAINCIKICPSILTITGSKDQICAGENYSINLPAGATVSWSANPPNLVNIPDPIANPVTVNRSGTSNGITTLIAAVGSGCTNATTVSKQLIIGKGASTINFTNVTINCDAGPYLYASYTPIPGATNCDWYAKDMSNASNPFVFLESALDGTDYPLRRDNRYYTIRAIVATPCGTLQGDYLQFAPDCVAGGNIVIAPNPVDTDMDVMMLDENTSLTSSRIYEISIQDKIGKIVFTKKYDGNTKKVTVNISVLKPDVYYIKVWNGKEWKSKQFLKQ